MELAAYFIDEARWSPGIGDPTPMGWITVLAYLAAAVLCARAGQAERRADAPARRVVLFWALLAAGMVGLGINKQLDLQSLLTQIGRDLAQRDGWYEKRGGIQKLFILVLGVLAAGSGAAMLLWLRRYLRELWLPILGGIAIASFVVLRASSFHKVDSLLGTYVGFVKMNWVLELGGIAMVAYGAWSAPRRTRTAQ